MYGKYRKNVGKASEKCRQNVGKKAKKRTKNVGKKDRKKPKKKPSIFNFDVIECV